MKMQLSKPKQIFDMNSFLPPDGEAGFEMSLAEDELSLAIYYEVDDSSERNAKRTMRFAQAKYFFKTPFPGYSFFSCPDDRDLSLLNSLVEYQHSDLLDVEHSPPGTAGYRHYRLFLHSVGVAIYVVAKSCDISDEELVG